VHKQLPRLKWIIACHTFSQSNQVPDSCLEFLNSTMTTSKIGKAVSSAGGTVSLWSVPHECEMIKMLNNKNTTQVTCCRVTDTLGYLYILHILTEEATTVITKHILPRDMMFSQRCCIGFRASGVWDSMTSHMTRILKIWPILHV